MAHLIILHPDVRVRARARDALNATHHTTVVQGWRELRTLAEGRWVDGCLVDADHPDRDRALSELAALRRAHPGTALVAWADVHASDPELLRFGALGVDRILLAGRPPWASGIRRTVEEALTVARARQAARLLAPALPAPAADAVAWAVEHGACGAAVGAMAGALGTTSRGLARTLAAASLPSPARLLGWGRIILAGALLERDGLTVEEAALRLGYSTAHGLARAMKRETGHTPGDVAARGGLPFVLACLVPPRAGG